MTFSDNPAVRAAYDAGEYTDSRGTRWVKGMDGWFDYSNKDMIVLTWHHHFVEMVEQENPQVDAVVN